jgi:hypothetical protein
VLERSPAVAREVDLGDCRLGVALGVQAPLELPEHQAEQGMAPGNLGERASVAGKPWQLAARRVLAIGERSEGPGREMLGERNDRTTEHRCDGEHRRQVGVDRTEDDPVLHVQRKSNRVPAVASCDRLAQQLYVVITAAEGELVERLLERPNGRGNSATDCPSKRASAIDASAQPPQL